MEKPGASKTPLVRRIRERSGKSLPILLLYTAFLLFTLVILFLRLSQGERKEACICLAAMATFFVPLLVEKICRVRLPALLEGIALVFIFSSLLLGEIYHMYMRIPIWDGILHFVSGFMFAAFGYCLVDIFSGKAHARALVSPFFLTFVAVCFSMSVSVVWEFFEFIIDNICHMDMQKDTLITGFFSTFLDESGQNIAVGCENIVKTTVEMEDGRTVVLKGYLDIGLMDTVEDMFIHFFGTAIFAVIGIVDAKKHGEGKIGSLFIPEVRRMAPVPAEGMALAEETASPEGTVSAEGTASMEEAAPPEETASPEGTVPPADSDGKGGAAGTEETAATAV